MSNLLLGAEPHHALDAGAVVPTAVEDHDLSGRRQVRDIALGVHLRLFPLGWRGECHHSENARAHTLGHSLDRAALACSVAPFEDDADLQARVHPPLLELDELDMQAGELPLVLLPLQLIAGRKIIVLLVGHRFGSHDQALVPDYTLMSAKTRASINIKVLAEADPA